MANANTQVERARERSVLSRVASLTFQEILSPPESEETSFCGLRTYFDTCVARPWEEYELENQKIW